jgi:hypothetical protein
MKLLHVSDSSSVHHQEFFTVHTAVLYVIQFCRQLSSRIRMELSYILILLANKFEKLVHLVGFIIRTCHDARSHVTMHGHMNLKCVLFILTKELQVAQSFLGS